MSSKFVLHATRVFLYGFVLYAGLVLLFDQRLAFLGDEEHAIGIGGAIVSGFYGGCLFWVSWLGLSGLKLVALSLVTEQ